VEKLPPEMKLNLPKEPISELQERIRKDPGNSALLRRLGKRFHEAGKPHEGEKHLLKALELEPQNVENHFALAEFYNSMGLKIKAFKHLNIVLQLQPNNEHAMDLLNLKKSKKALYEIEH
jgi:tetratricopeptide (TPR) repeat protein